MTIVGGKNRFFFVRNLSEISILSAVEHSPTARFTYSKSKADVYIL